MRLFSSLDDYSSTVPSTLYAIQVLLSLKPTPLLEQFTAATTAHVLTGVKHAKEKDFTSGAFKKCSTFNL